MRWFKEHLRELLALAAGLLAGAMVFTAVGAQADPSSSVVTSGSFPMTCTVTDNHLSCAGDLPTAAPTSAPPTTEPPTSAPPTTVPPTTEPPTSTAPPVETAGPRVPINGSTTGFPAGTTLTPFFGQPASNTTYVGRAFSAGTVTASNVTFRNCSFSSGPVFTGNNVTVDHCTFTGGVSLSGGDNFTFTNNNVVNWHGDAMHVTSDSGPVNHVVVNRNWFHNPNASCNGDHVDGFQMLGVNGVDVEDNIIDLGPWVSCGSDPGDGPLNGAFQVENTQGPDINGTITHNRLNGGGIVARFYQCQSFSFTWNQFGSTFQFSEVTVPPANRACFNPGPWANNRTSNGSLIPLP